MTRRCAGPLGWEGEFLDVMEANKWFGLSRAARRRLLTDLRLGVAAALRAGVPPDCIQAVIEPRPGGGVFMAVCAAEGEVPPPSSSVH